MNITIKKEHLMLHHTASKDETRYHLCGVYFDLVKGQVVATDGHKLGILPLDTSDIERSADDRTTLLIRVDDCKALLKLMRKNKTEYCVAYVQDNVVTCHVRSVQDSDKHIFEVCPSTSNYPDYNQVIPNYDPSFEISFNADYLATLKKALISDKRTNFKLQFKSHLDPIKLLVENKMVGVLMPCRMN